MSAIPVDGHGEEFEQLAGLAAMDLLEGDELVRFEEHAVHCEPCQVMERLDRQALAHLSLVAAPMDPSPDFKTRLMERAAAELAASSAVPAAPVPIRPRVIPLWRRSPWISSLAAVLVLGLVGLGGYVYENQPVATYELTGSTPGKALVVVRRSGAAELTLDGVPDPGQGFLYEAWIIPPGGQPVAAGTTTSGEGRVPLPSPMPGSTVAITRERSRVDAPTSAPLLAAVVQS